MSDIDSDRMFVHIHHGKGQIHMPYTDKPLPKSSIHAVHLLEAGVNLRFVQEYLGHSDHRTTIIFRAKVKDALKKSELFKQVSPQVRQQNWVVHIEPVGNGHAVLKYLAPYVFRITISNRNILELK